MERGIPRKGDRVSMAWQGEATGTCEKQVHFDWRMFCMKEAWGNRLEKRSRARNMEIIKSHRTWLDQSSVLDRLSIRRWGSNSKEIQNLKTKSRPPWKTNQSWMQYPDPGHHTMADAIIQASSLTNLSPIDPAWYSWLKSDLKFSCNNNVAGGKISIIMQKIASNCCSSKSRCCFYWQYLWPQRIHIFQIQI